MTSSLALTKDQLFDAIIIGGGPAGCQCGLWLKMLGYNPIILEKKPKLGGLQNLSPYESHWVVCVPGQIGERVAEAMEENIIRHGVPNIKNVNELKISENDDKTFTAKIYTELSNYVLIAAKIVIATGVANKSGGFVASDKVIIGTGNNIHNCKFLNKKVAILGGGDSALENYSFIKNKGAKLIKLFARTLRARPALVKQVPQEDIIRGEFNANQSSMEVNGDAFDMFCVMYGWKPNVPLPNQLHIQLTESGFIKVDNNCRTSNENIFAIGECTQRMHPCVTTAMADGVVAAKAMQSDFELLE